MRRKAEKVADKMMIYYKRGHIRRAKICSLVLRILFACDMPESVEFSSNAELVHNGLGCVFHPAAIIGPGCKIYQNVTIGGNGKIVNGVLSNLGAPKLEKNVAVFAGACVIGPVTIGQNSLIGANAVVSHDVPSNKIATGNPAVIKDLKIKYNFD